MANTETNREKGHSKNEFDSFMNGVAITFTVLTIIFIALGILINNNSYDRGVIDYHSGKTIIITTPDKTPIVYQINDTSNISGNKKIE